MVHETCVIKCTTCSNTFSEFTKLAEKIYHSFQWFVGNPHDTIAHMGWTKFVCDNEGKDLVCMCWIIKIIKNKKMTIAKNIK